LLISFRNHPNRDFRSKTNYPDNELQKYEIFWNYANNLLNLCGFAHEEHSLVDKLLGEDERIKQKAERGGCALLFVVNKI
jgi:hypothetical protein